MDETDKTQDLKGKLDTNRVEFILTEIELGLTFVEVALTTSNKETRERNLTNAQKAHDSGIKFLAQDSSLTVSTRGEIEASLARLKHQIDRLNY